MFKVLDDEQQRRTRVLKRLSESYTIPSRGSTAILIVLVLAKFEVLKVLSFTARRHLRSFLTTALHNKWNGKWN